MSHPDLPPGIVDQAIAWAVKLQFGEPDANQRQAFEQWRQAHPQHEHAWQRVCSLGHDFEQVPPTLLEHSLQRLEQQRHSQQRSRRQTLKGLFGTAVLLGGGGYGAYRHSPWQRLLADTSTRIGEQQALDLGNGRQVVLNTDSALSIQARTPHVQLNLHRGELFMRQPPTAGPTQLHCSFGQLDCQDGHFSLRLLGGQALVQVIHGDVTLSPRHGAPARLLEGQTALFDTRAIRSTTAPPFSAEDWSQGLLNARNLRLDVLLRELTRYRPGLLSWDQAAAKLPVSGLYQLADIDQTLAFLAQTLPIEVRYFSRYWVRIHAV